MKMVRYIQTLNSLDRRFRKRTLCAMINNLGHDFYTQDLMLYANDYSFTLRVPDLQYSLKIPFYMTIDEIHMRLSEDLYHGQED